MAKDVQLRLTDTEAEATTLLQLQLDLLRSPSGAAAGGKDAKGKQRAGGSGGAAAADASEAAAAGGPAAGKSLAVMDDPPDSFRVAAAAGARLGPHETWSATVQIRGDLQRGTLKFVPLVLQRVGAAHDTVQLAPDALMAMFGGRNDTELLFV